MTRFTQEILQPGSFHVGGGRFASFTRDDLSEIALSTRELLKSGNGVPILLEHAEPGSAAGAPRDRHDAKASQVRNGVGWVEDVRLNELGRLVAEFDVTDSDAARKLGEGSIRFTSPELRKEWSDGKGRTFKNIASHLALTHKPRNAEQGKIKALQFSLDDYESGFVGATVVPWSTLQLADDGENPFKRKRDGDGDGESGEGESNGNGNGGESTADDKSSTPPEEPENPDLPIKADDGKEAQRMEAIVAHLSELGVVLPADTDLETFQDRLLTALMTAAASKRKAEEEEAAKAQEGLKEEKSAVEQQPLMQFSLADAEGGKVPNKILARFIQSEARDLHARAKKIPDMTPARLKQLFAHRGAMQFSADADLAKAFTLTEVLDILESTALPGLQLAASGEEQEHPAGKQFTHGDGKGNVPETEEEAERIADQVFGRQRKAS